MDYESVADDMRTPTKYAPVDYSQLKKNIALVVLKYHEVCMLSNL